ncbi:hypothetical protein MMC09_003566 [Bachmanniomyces sp. S44760]|nr:hypothetical protein [Bachmanniomyces sp. S44760]
MKKAQIARWSASALSPRRRTGLYCFQCQFTTPSRHAQSTATSPLQDVADDAPPPVTPGLSGPELRQLPTPPPSRVLSSAKLSALHARLSLDPRLPIQTLARCLIDPTADPDPHYNNNSLALLGTALLGYHTSESILCRYPRLPMSVVFAVMWAYVGSKTLDSMRREWGVECVAEPGGEVDAGLLQCRRQVAGNAEVGSSGRQVKELEASTTRPNAARGWKRGLSSRSMYDDYFGDEIQPRSPNEELLKRENGNLFDVAGKSVTTLQEASTQFVRAVMGAVYLHGGRKAAKIFFKEHILSRHLEVGKMFEFKQPTRDLSRLCAREGFASPIARILAETGRMSRHPVFVVGVFSGNDKLGEGAGASLDEARFRAAVSALKGWYLYSPVEVQVPSDAEGNPAKPWKPVLIDGGEVVA